MIEVVNNVPVCSKCICLVLFTNKSLVCAAGHPGTGLRGSSLSSGPQLKTGLPASIAQCLPPDLHHLIYTNAVPPSLGDNYGSQVSVQHDGPLTGRYSTGE